MRGLDEVLEEVGDAQGAEGPEGEAAELRVLVLAVLGEGVDREEDVVGVVGRSRSGCTGRASS